MTSHDVMQTYDWVLVEVIVCASCNGVELHEVVKVGELPAHPLVGQARALQESGRFTDANPVQIWSAQIDDTTVDL